MKVKQVTWGRTKSSNFQAQRAEVTIEINNGETVDDALNVARLIVDRALGDAPSDAEIEKAKSVIATAESLKRAKIR